MFIVSINPQTKLSNQCGLASPESNREVSGPCSTSVTELNFAYIYIQTLKYKKQLAKTSQIKNYRLYLQYRHYRPWRPDCRHVQGWWSARCQQHCLVECDCHSRRSPIASLPTRYKRLLVSRRALFTKTLIFNAVNSET